MAAIWYKPTFRNENAKKYFNKKCNNMYCYEAGVDNKGNIYFAYMNGIVERYSRREFLRIANKYYFDIMETK